MDKNGLLLACYLQDTRIADDAPTKGSTSPRSRSEKETPPSIKPKPIRPIIKPRVRKPFPKHCVIRPKDKHASVRCRGYGMGSERWPDGFRKLGSGQERKQAERLSRLSFYFENAVFGCP